MILITVQAIAMLDYGLSAYTITISSVTESLQGSSNSKMIVQLNKNPTLDSRIDVAPWINVASGKFEKNLGVNESPKLCQVSGRWITLIVFIFYQTKILNSNYKSKIILTKGRASLKLGRLKKYDKETPRIAYHIQPKSFQ